MMSTNDDRGKPPPAFVSDTQGGRHAAHNSLLSLILVRLCAFVLDELYSLYVCWPFVSPVADTATLYHKAIERPMDLTTVEHHLHRHKYATYAEFERDLLLIWNNAKQFHRPLDLLYELAERLNLSYSLIKSDCGVDKGLDALAAKYSESLTAEEMATKTLATASTDAYRHDNALYFMQAIAPDEGTPKASRGFAKVRYVYDSLNAPFTAAVEREQLGISDPADPLPRLYFSKNRSLLTEARDMGDIVAVMTHVCTTRATAKRRDLVELSANIVLVHPIGSCHEIDLSKSDPIMSPDFLPKAWIKVKIIKVIPRVKAIITDAMEKTYFRRAYTTHRLSLLTRADIKKAKDQDIAAHFIQAIINGQQSLDSVRSDASPSLPPKLNSAARAQHHHATATATTFGLDNMEPPTTSTTVNVTETVTADHSVHPGAQKGHRSDADPAQRPSSSPAAQDPMIFTRYLGPGDAAANDPSAQARREHYLKESSNLWKKVFSYCDAKQIPIVNVSKYLANRSVYPNAAGYFKQVHYVRGNDGVVVQTFRRMTITQRTTEVVCLLALQGLPRMGQIVEVLCEDNGEVIGLSMQKYEKTLKQHTHAHSHHRLTAHQKMDLIRQMLECMETIHDAGIAHRDLSEVNFMVNESDGPLLPDGSKRSDVYLIDFGKAVFTKPNDVKMWWVDRPIVEGEYEGEVQPETQQELIDWCTHLPWVKAKPDHGYRHYRSIQTLPRTRVDVGVLPWLIHPMAEDMYSLGTIIWKVFSDTEPWHGILDTDLRGLRETVKDDFTIERTIEREVPGALSRELLLMLVRSRPENRKSASEVLAWLDQPAIYDGLIREWKANAPVSRTKRHAKVAFEVANENAFTQKRQRPNHKRACMRTPPPPPPTPQNRSTLIVLPRPQATSTPQHHTPQDTVPLREGEAPPSQGRAKRRSRAGNGGLQTGRQPKRPRVTPAEPSGPVECQVPSVTQTTPQPAPRTPSRGLYLRLHSSLFLNRP